LNPTLGNQREKARQDMFASITINQKQIGPGFPVYIIAEMSANHNGDFEQAVKIIHAAKEAGADAIKLQTYTPETLTIDCNTPYFFIGKGTVWEGRSLYELYGEAYMPWHWQPKLKEIANQLDIEFFSTPFDPTSVDFLEKMDVPAYKIASFELNDLPLIRMVAGAGKPIVLSTGMANLTEIAEAVHTIRDSGNNQIALLKCTSAYPAPPEEINLRTISHLSESFNVPVGLSDHTMGIGVPIAAAALGACIVEKHFTLSRSISGPDSSFSLEPEEFKAMVDGIRLTEKALGKVCYEITEHEAACRIFRRSLFVVQNLRAGERLTHQNTRSIRPGYGLSPKHIDDVIGKRVSIDISRGTPLQWEFIIDENN